jgi:hypothetical protein
MNIGASNLCFVERNVENAMITEVGALGNFRLNLKKS